jgi:PIN domain nuclease of toxin-antitoxin system
VKYLLDSVAWLWSIADPDRLNRSAREIIQNGREEVFLSAASSWELSIKARTGKLQLPGPPRQCIPAYMAKQGLKPLPITHLHTVRVYELAAHHTDPFDRLLIAQAMVEDMAILTADRAFEQYPLQVVWCAV